MIKQREKRDHDLSELKEECDGTKTTGANFMEEIIVNCSCKKDIKHKLIYCGDCKKPFLDKSGLRFHVILDHYDVSKTRKKEKSK